MKKTLILVAACCAAMSVAVAGASAESTSTDPVKVAKALCVDQKNADKAAFAATYGERNAMRNCKRAARGTAEQAVANASQECRAEQETDPAAFQATYGSNGNGKNAFGKCVSGKVSEDTAEEVEEFKNAAQECRAEREADPAAFQATYGTNANKKNAFGKCVTSKVHSDDEEPAPTA